MRATLLCITVAFCLLLPTASAHERYFSSDDRFLIILGEQDEPVYTYDFTNLDLIVRDNITSDPIEGLEEALDAVLIAPDGSELTHPLKAQHGEVGRYEFTEAYTLTMRGQYKVRLTGSIGGTDVSGTYLLPGPRGDFTDITFPANDVQDLRALEARIAELEARLETIAPSDAEADVSNGAPGLGALGILIAMGAALALVRRS